jgi:hypothetical protein
MMMDVRIIYIGQDDADHSDERFDVDELMCNVASNVLL